jgi:hypothetical protein
VTQINLREAHNAFAKKHSSSGLLKKFGCKTNASLPSTSDNIEASMRCFRRKMPTVATPPSNAAEATPTGHALTNENMEPSQPSLSFEDIWATQAAP